MAMPASLMWLPVPQAVRRAGRVHFGSPVPNSSVVLGYIAQVWFVGQDTLYWADHPGPATRWPTRWREIDTQLLQLIPGSTQVTISYGFVGMFAHAEIVGN